MAWKPIRTVDDLPKPGIVESDVLDLKRRYDRNAKGQTGALRDLASFANANGGTVIVGADEDPNTAALTRYVGIPDAEAEGRRVKQLALARLDPQPDVETVPIAIPSLNDGRHVLAINVAPFPGVVAVRHDMKWEFYVRRERLNHPATFGEAEKMLTQDRRGRLLLEQIPETSWNRRITVDAELRKLPRGGWSIKKLGPLHVDLTAPGGVPVELPYAFIAAVWPTGGLTFTVSVDAAISLIHPPSNAGGKHGRQIVVQKLRAGLAPPAPDYQPAG